MQNLGADDRNVRVFDSRNPAHQAIAQILSRTGWTIEPLTGEYDMSGDSRVFDFDDPIFDTVAITQKNSFAGASLAGQIFAGCDLRNMCFAGADLRGADFSNADLRGADLSGADLTGARMVGARLDNINLKNATMASVTFVDLFSTR